MPFYESVFITRQDLSAQAVEDLADRFAELIKTNGGSVEKREYWGLRSLAYRIKKNRKGHYVLFGVDATAQTMREFERHLGLDENLLRHLTVRVDAIDPEPSPMMKAGDDEKPYARRFSSSKDQDGHREHRQEREIQEPSPEMIEGTAQPIEAALNEERESEKIAEDKSSDTKEETSS